MKEFTHIWKHYAMRTLRRPITWALYLGLPLGITLVNVLAGIGLAEGMGAEAQGQMVGNMVTLMILSFQFFSSEVLYYDLFTTLRGEVANRLYMSPVKQNKFFIGAVGWSWIFSIFQAAVIFTIVYLVFPEAYFPSFWLLGTMVLIVSILSQLKGALMPLIAKTRKSADGISAIVCFGMMFLSGGLLVNFGESDFAVFLMTRSNPLALAWSALQQDTAWQRYLSGDLQVSIPDPTNFITTNLIILGIVMVVLAAVVVILGKRRKTA